MFGGGAGAANLHPRTSFLLRHAASPRAATENLINQPNLVLLCCRRL